MRHEANLQAVVSREDLVGIEKGKIEKGNPSGAETVREIRARKRRQDEGVCEWHVDTRIPPSSLPVSLLYQSLLEKKHSASRTQDTGYSPLSRSRTCSTSKPERPASPLSQKPPYTSHNNAARHTHLSTRQPWSLVDIEAQ